MKKVTLIAILTLFSINAEANLHREVLSEFHDLTKEIKRRFSPTEYYYLGVGTSPVAIIEIMRQQGLEASQMSLSKAKDWYREVQSDPRLKAILWEHFSNFIPQTKKKILLVDFAKSGGIFLVEKLVSEFLSEQRRGSIVETVGFGKYGNRERSFPNLSEKHWISIKDGPPWLYDALNDHDYEGLGKRKGFRPPHDRSEYKMPELNENYSSTEKSVSDFLKNADLCESL